VTRRTSNAPGEAVVSKAAFTTKSQSPAAPCAVRRRRATAGVKKFLKICHDGRGRLLLGVSLRLRMMRPVVLEQGGEACGLRSCCPVGWEIW